MASAEGFVIEPGGIATAEVCVVNKSFDFNCIYSMNLVEQNTAGEPDPDLLASPSSDGPFSAIGPDGEHCVEIEWTADDPLDATKPTINFFRYYVEFQPTNGPPCVTRPEFQVVPTDEETLTGAWSTALGYTTAYEFGAKVLPDDSVFDGWKAKEHNVDVFDDCYFDGSELPRCNPHGGEWTILSDNTFAVPDTIGPDELYVGYYRSEAVTPCACTFTQKMLWKVPTSVHPTGFYQYKQNSDSAELDLPGANDIRNTRDTLPVSKTCAVPPC